MLSVRRFRYVSTASLALALLAPQRPHPLAAQQPQPGVPLLTANARLVVLDVVVTDRNGKPVDDLRQQDLQVYEAGKLQPIRSFEAPGTQSLPELPTTDFDPAKPASFGRSPVNIFLLDQSNTHFSDSPFARRSLHDYLAAQPALLPQPSALLGLYDRHFKQLQPFTRDRDALLSALQHAPLEYPWQLELNGKAEYGPLERLDHALRSLQQVAQSYTRIVGRKNLIWVGAGFPSVDPNNLATPDALEIKQTLKRVTNLLIDSRITLYAVDPTSSAPRPTEVIDSTQMDFVQAAGDALTGDADPFGATEDFDALGPASGGRVIRGRNDLSAQIARSVDLGSHAYTLSYRPTSADQQSAQFRPIKVLCLRPGLTATTRTGYYPNTSLEPASKLAAAELATYDLTTAADSSLPLYGLLLKAEPQSGPHAPKGAYILHVALPDLAWHTKPDGGATASVYVTAVSLDAKGIIVSQQTHPMTATAKPGTDLSDPARTADFNVQVQPSPKTAALRFVIRDSENGRMGTADLPKP